MTGNPHHTGPPASKPPMSALPPTAADTRRMTENSPPPAARTPGQAARLAFEDHRDKTLDASVRPSEFWDKFHAECWEAAAQAAIAAAPEIMQLRERAAQLEAANAALVLAQPDTSQAAEIAALQEALTETQDAAAGYRAELARLRCDDFVQDRHADLDPNRDEAADR